MSFNPENVFDRHVVIDAFLVKLASTGLHAAVDLALLALDDRVAKVAFEMRARQHHFVSILDQVQGVVQLGLSLLLLLRQRVQLILDLLLVEFKLLIKFVFPRVVLGILLLDFVL